MVCRSRLQSIIARKTRRLELEADGHITSTKSRRMVLHAQACFAVLQSPGPKPREWCHPLPGWGFLYLLTQPSQFTHGPA